MLKPNFKKLNPRLLIAHGAIMLIFMFAFQLYASLYSVQITTAALLDNSSKEAMHEIAKKGLLNDGTFTYYWLFNGISSFAGLLTAFFISLSITIFRKWFWLNSLLVFIVLYFANKLNLTGWNHFKILFFTPGKIWFRGNLYLYFFICATVFNISGLLLFFLKPVNNFIEGYDKGKETVAFNL